MKHKNKFFYFFYLLVLFLVSNIFCHLIILKFAKLSIYDQEYLEKKRKYIKHTTNVSYVHPFYGLQSGVNQGFDSKLSAEGNFVKISKKPTKKEIKVLIVGGSVALQFSNKLDDRSTQDYLFSDYLNKKFNTDRFVVYNAAINGAKQPQQYFKILYLNLLGFRPDIIVNYDGFNEMALPFTENLKKGLNAIYPRSWNETIYGSAIQGDSCIARNNILISFNSYLPIIELPKILYILNCHNKVTESKKPIKFFTEEFITIETENYESRVKNIWLTSSNLIYEFANSHHIEYIHGIQPNQYYPSSKIFSEAEVVKFQRRERYKKVIPKLYEEMPISEIKTPNFIDHRLLFKDLTDTVYSDACCHFNDFGLKFIIRSLVDDNQEVFKRALSD